MNNEKNPLVSVIINCYNCEKYVLEALRSIKYQTYKNIEVIFIDNCSSDESLVVLNRAGLKVKLKTLDATIPLYEARNVALNMISGEYVAFLDSDDIWHHSKIEEQIKIFDEKTSLVYCKRNFIDNNSKNISKKDSNKYSGNVTNKLLLSPFIPMSSVILKSSAILTMRFNPNYNLVGDFDMWIRVSMGGQVKFVNKPLLFDRLHIESTGKVNKSYWIQEKRNFYKIFLKDYKVKYPSIFPYIIRVEVRNLLELMKII
jgi:glycosyltransferase involved in cell wall biosynthesis